MDLNKYCCNKTNCHVSHQHPGSMRHLGTCTRLRCLSFFLKYMTVHAQSIVLILNIIVGIICLSVNVFKVLVFASSHISDYGVNHLL